MMAENGHENLEIEAGSLEIEEHIEDVIAEEHGEAVFECKVNGHPLPIVSWYKNGELITSNQRMKITSHRNWHRLEISNVSIDDHGIYTILCRKGSKQISSKANLFVANRNSHDGVFYTDANSESIKVIQHLHDVKIEKGNGIELKATFEFEASDASYIWFKNNELLTRSRRTFIFDFNKSTCLCVQKCEFTDSGIYSVVVKTKHGIVSSYADVQVTAVEEFACDDKICPFIEESLPNEVEANENEDVRLICKASIDTNTTIKWFKDGEIFEETNFTIEDYGNHYIGLRGVNVSGIDTGEYTICLRDAESGIQNTSSCFLSINPAPTRTPPTVELERPLRSAVATCGSRVAFDCSFDLKDPKYFYVVWHVGLYKVERSNNRFSVVYKNGIFVLYIKSVELAMCGEIVCELRKALPNQRSVHVSRSIASLVVIPVSILLEEKKTYSSGKLYDATAPCTDIELPMRSSTSSNGHNHHSDVILEITFCRLDEAGVFFLDYAQGDSEVVVNRLSARYEPNSSSNTVVVIQWEDSAVPATHWYRIEMAQSDGSYVEAGVSSLPSFETQDVPLERMLCFRIRTAPAESDTAESTVRIVPVPDTIVITPKIHELRQMEEFEPIYTKTDNLIGCGSFGSVVLVHDRKGEFYAAKILKTRTQKKRDTAMREFNIMKQLSHPKLVQLMDAFVAKDNFILVMDYLWGGELFDRVVEEEYLKEVDVVPYVKQICEALQYLHTCKIAHLDLKPENMVCLSRNSVQVKIIDFGLARVLEEGVITRAIYGTREYVAPEVLNFERLTLACDMWSLGVVTYVLLSGVLPFAGDAWLTRSASITSAKYNYDDAVFYEISDLAKDFVDKLLVLKAENRMSAAAALDHKWIKEGPPKGVKAGHMKRTRENLKSYLANYRERWQRAGNVMIAAHRLRTHAGGARCTQSDSVTCVPQR